MKRSSWFTQACRCAVLIGALLAPAAAEGVVLYEEGRLTLNGITLLRDKDDPSSYFYIPPYPRVATHEDGLPQMTFVTYVGETQAVSGGLLHFLFTLQLPEDVIEELQRRLDEEVPGARLRGPVPLLVKKEEEGYEGPKPSFMVTSSTLTSGSGAPGAEGAVAGFRSQMVTSGVAPVTPGSLAAVSALLSPESTTLLDATLKSPTSDISVAITAYYEAALPSYQGRVFADLSTVYEHFFAVQNRQANYSKRELRDHMDELQRNGVIDVSVTSRAGVAGTSTLGGLMDLVTTKLVDMLFDTTQGLSQLPEQEKVPEDVVAQRAERSWFQKTFGGNENPKFVTEDQYTLRRREDIRRGTFSLSFTENTTIQVPFNTAGNMRGFFEVWGDDERLFKIVSPQASKFLRREILFQVDPDFYDAFSSVINSASVEIKKSYPGLDQPDFVGEARFGRDEVKSGTFSKTLSYPKLGLQGLDASSYEYRVIWSFRGGQTVSFPSEDPEDFAPSRRGILDLAPPKDKVSVFIELDESSLIEEEVRRVSLSVEYRLMGRRKFLNKSFRPGETENYMETNFIRDERSPVRYRIRWMQDGNRNVSSDWTEVEDTELSVVLAGPPTAEPEPEPEPELEPAADEVEESR